MDEQGLWAGLRERRWTRSDAEWAVAEWAKSGESVVAFAKRHEIRANRLYDWRRRLEKRSAKSDQRVIAAQTLVPVLVRQVPPENARGSSSCPVVVSTGSARVEVHELSSTSRSWVAQLLGLGGA